MIFWIMLIKRNVHNVNPNFFLLSNGNLSFSTITDAASPNIARGKNQTIWSDKTFLENNLVIPAVVCPPKLPESPFGPPGPPPPGPPP